MTSTTTISLNKLLAWEGNVRKTGADTNIDELAASISAHGLLQSLVVRKDGRKVKTLQCRAEARHVVQDLGVCSGKLCQIPVSEDRSNEGQAIPTSE